MAEEKRAILALADGRFFEGLAFGYPVSPDKPALGEVVFNTSQYGYQEILTDPSYAGQIMCFTYPHIGNVGCNQLDVESSKVHVRGVLVRELSKIVSNYRAELSLSDYLRNEKVMGISGVDTRALVRHIRDSGAQAGAMAFYQAGELQRVRDLLVDQARNFGSMQGKDFVKQVSCDKPYSWQELPWNAQKNLYPRVSQEQLLARPHVIAVDCGAKRNILRLLLASGFRVTVVPATFTDTQILDLHPDALFLSNGPGDPATVTYTVSTVEKLLGRLPIFGICLGHQILAQAVGAKTYKLKFGHRGANHPVMDLTTRKVEITVQNHGFAVDESTLGKDVRLSHLNLNDQTVEGIEVDSLNAFSVQYHPEASAGPHDSEYLFKRFFSKVVGA